MSAGIIASPVYIYKSGLPQPADIILLLFSMMMIMSLLRRNVVGGVNISGVLPFQWLLLVLWVNLVLLVWSLLTQSYDTLVHGVYWVYNYLVVFSIFMFLSRHNSFLYYFELSVSLSLIVSLIGIVVEPGAGGRSTGFFNNPNQMAYYALCGLSILQVINKGLFSLRLINVIALMAGVISILSAASLAAMAGLFLLVVAHFIAARQLFAFARTVVVIIIAAFVLSILDLPLLDRAVQNFEIRMLRADDKISGVSEERNYDRITNNPKYVVLGAGEGNLSRFGDSPLEIHSSFGNLLFCYGVVGLSLFLIIIYRSTINAPVAVWFVTLAPLVYSVTHMGLRTTLFWVLVGLLWFLYGNGKSKGSDERGFVIARNGNS